MKEEILIFRNFNDIFDLLIEDEEEAIEVYHSMARRSQNLESRKAFEQFVRDETGHFMELKKMRGQYPGGNFDQPLRVKAIKPSKTIHQPEELKKMTYHDILRFAIEEEQKSEQLYLNIANQLEFKQVNELFVHIAREEKKHRLRLEKMLSLKD